MNSIRRRLPATPLLVLLLIGLACLLSCLATFAQENVVPEVAAVPPGTGLAWPQVLIPVLVPVLLGLAKVFLPKLPKVWLPILAPLLGAAIDLLASGSWGSSTILGMISGSAGVGLRELYDQVKKRTISEVKAVFPASVILLPLLFLPSCARFTTKQTDTSYDQGKPSRTITTKASTVTFFDSKSSLSNFKATQTDKTQSASVGVLSQESSGTNAADFAGQILGAAIRNAVAPK